MLPKVGLPGLLYCPGRQMPLNALFSWKQLTLGQVALPSYLVSCISGFLWCLKKQQSAIALQFGSDDACLVCNDLLIVAPTFKVGDPQARLEQPLGSPANDVCTLKCPVGIGKPDALVTTHRCGTLAVLRYSPRAARFIVVQRITVAAVPGAAGLANGLPGHTPPAQLDDPNTLVGAIAASDPRGRAVALAATRHRIAVFFAAAYATPSDPQAFEEAMKVWQTDPLLQASQPTPPNAASTSPEEHAAAAAIVREALLGKPPPAAAPLPAPDSMDDVGFMPDPDPSTAHPSTVHSPGTPSAPAPADTVMADGAGTADSMARLSISGEGDGTPAAARAGRAGTGGASPAPAGDVPPQRRGLFLQEDPVTWNALKHSWAHDVLHPGLEAHRRTTLAKKHAVMRAAGFTDIAPHGSDAGQVDEDGVPLQPFRCAEIADVTFLNFPDPFGAAQPPVLGGGGSGGDSGGGSGSAGGSAHGGVRAGSSVHAGRGGLRGAGGSAAALLGAAHGASGSVHGAGSAGALLGDDAAPSAPPAPASAAAGVVRGQLSQLLRRANNAALPADAGSTPRPDPWAPTAEAAAPPADWARVHVVMLTCSTPAPDDGPDDRSHSDDVAMQQECALLQFELRGGRVEELRRCDVNSAGLSSSRGPFNVGAAHTVMPVPGAPSSVTLLTPHFALFRDFCTPAWVAGEVGCWSCAVTPDAPLWSAPGIVPISAAAPQSRKLRRVPSMVPSHVLPQGAFDLSDVSSDSDSAGSGAHPPEPMPGAMPPPSVRHRFRRDAPAPPASATPSPSLAGRFTAAAWLQGLHDSSAIGSTRGGTLGGAGVMGRSASRANLVGGLERSSGSLLDDCMSTESGRAQRRKRTFANAMHLDRPPRPGLSRVPGTSIIKATPAATKVPRSSEPPVTAIQLFVSSCAPDPCSLIAVTACVSARPSVRPADGHVAERAGAPSTAAAAAAVGRVAVALGGEASVQCVRNVFAVDALAAPFKPGPGAAPWPGAAAGQLPERQHPLRMRASADIAMAPADDGRTTALDLIAAIAAESSDPTDYCAVRPAAPLVTPLCLISGPLGFVLTASSTGSILAYRPCMVSRPHSLSSRVRSADKAAQHVHHYRLLQEYPHCPPSDAIGTLVRPHEEHGGASEPHQPRAFQRPTVTLAAASGQLLTLSQAAELVPLHGFRLASVVHDLHACGGGGDVIVVSSAMHAMTVRLPEVRLRSLEMDHGTAYGALMEEPDSARVAQFSEIAGGACAAAASVPDVGLRAANSQLFLYSDRLDVYISGRHPAGDIPMTSAGGFAGQCGTVWRRAAGETLVAAAAACGGLAAAVVVGALGAAPALAVWSIAIEEGPSADARDPPGPGSKGAARLAWTPLEAGTALVQQEVLMYCQGSDQPERSIVRAAMTCMAVEGTASCLALCPSPSPLSVPSHSGGLSAATHSLSAATGISGSPSATALQWLAAIISWDASATIAALSVNAPGRSPSIHILQAFDLAAAVALHFPALDEAPRPNSAVLWAPPQPPADPDSGPADLAPLGIVAVLAVGMRGGQLAVTSLRGEVTSAAADESAFLRPRARTRRAAGFAAVDSVRSMQGMLASWQIVPEASLALGTLPVTLHPLNSDPFMHGGTVARREMPRTFPSVASLEHMSAHGGALLSTCASCGNASGTPAVMTALHCVMSSDTMHTLTLEIAPGGSLGLSKSPITTSDEGGAGPSRVAVLACTTSHTKTGRCIAEYRLAIARNLPDASADITTHNLLWPQGATIASEAPSGLHAATLPRVHAHHRAAECTPKPAAPPASGSFRSSSRTASTRDDPPQRFTHLTHVRIYGHTHALAFSEPPSDPHATGRAADHHLPSAYLHTLDQPPPGGLPGELQPPVATPPPALAPRPIWTAPRGHTLTAITPWTPFPTQDPAAYAAAWVSNHANTAAGVRSAAHRGLLPPLFLVAATANRFVGTASALLDTPLLTHSFASGSAVSKLHILGIHMQHRPAACFRPAPFAPASAAAPGRTAGGSRLDGRPELYPPFDPDALEIRAVHSVAVHTIRSGALTALASHRSHLFAACGTAIWTYRFPTRVPSMMRGDSPKAANTALAELPAPSTVKVLQPVLSMTVDAEAQLLVVVDCLHGVQLFSLPVKKATGRSMEPIQCIAGSAIMRPLTCAVPWPPRAEPSRPPRLHTSLAPCTSYMFRCEPLPDGTEPLLPWDVRLVAAMATGVLRPQLSPYQAAWLRGLAGTSPCGTTDSAHATAQHRLERVVNTASRPSRAVSAACRQAEVIAATVAAACSCGPPPPQPLPLEATVQVLLLAELRTGADAAAAAATAATGTPLPATRPADAGVLHHTLSSSIPRLAEALNEEFIPSWPPAVTLNTVAADEAEDLMLSLFALYSSCMPTGPTTAAAQYPRQTFLGVELAPSAGASPAASAAAAAAAANAFRDAVCVPERPMVCELVAALDRVRGKWAERPRAATPCSLAFMFLMHVTLNHFVAADDARPAAPLFGSPAQHEAQELLHVQRIVHEAEEAMIAFLDFEDAAAEGDGGFDGAVPELMHGTRGWLRGRGYPADDAAGAHLSGHSTQHDADDPTGQAWVRKVMEDVPGSEHIEAFLVWWYIVCTGGGWPVDAAGDMHPAEGYKADGSGYPDTFAEPSSTDSLSKVQQQAGEVAVKQSGQLLALSQHGELVRLSWNRADWAGEDPPSSLLECMDACMQVAVDAVALCSSPSRSGGLLACLQGGAVAQLVPLSAAAPPARSDVAGGSVNALGVLLLRLQRVLLLHPATAPPGAWHGASCAASATGALWTGVLRQFATAPFSVQLLIAAAMLRDTYAQRAVRADSTPLPDHAAGAGTNSSAATLRTSVLGSVEALPATLGWSPNESTRLFGQVPKEHLLKARSVLLCAVHAVL
eukprot:jgi/Ulvmu1/9649/UM054_0081.1